MKITDATLCLATTNPCVLYDFYCSSDAAQAKQTELSLKGENYTVMTFGAYLQAQRDLYLHEDPQEITEERFQEMLTVLPPVAWTNTGYFESFLMSERLTGTYTSQYIRQGNRYFTKVVDMADRSTWMKKDCDRENSNYQTI